MRFLDVRPPVSDTFTPRYGLAPWGNSKRSFRCTVARLVRCSDGPPLLLFEGDGAAGRCLAPLHHTLRQSKKRLDDQAGGIR